MPLIKRGALNPENTNVGDGASLSSAPNPLTLNPLEVEALKMATSKVEPPLVPYKGRKTSPDTMSKEEWAAKDRRIGRAGLYQAALQSVGVNQYATGRTLAEYLAVVRQAAEDGLKFVNEEA